ncbi:NAD(P)/FAD-dependent oxidoreductase [Cochleicola gelatinilyticus]|uniref:FAD-dependent oxidoreductase n=1 Tax=Cochleicola gelatinilyticus TaxID=1763537 RepID=A0A167GWB0_9FLAO|nr:NAD(P)/FAD-dependent oxidoreductase [Cochleicola gelatinilyticus]OAB77970.1 FAD-dependent oxidoreductase [Cochleicola gelatinilyticus]
MHNKKYDLIIIGAGLAGLTAAIHLSNNNLSILVLERHTFPRHKVCGEYISNEVLPYLKHLGVDPLQAGAKMIDQFLISNKKGATLNTSLPLGGFGISRYALDEMLYNKCKQTVDFVFESVETVNFTSERFTVETQSKSTFEAKYVLGAFGKRSNLDLHLKRSFIQQKTPWMAVKAHYKYDLSEKSVQLHSFDGGYCGLSKVESNAVNACYLTTVSSFKNASSINDFQNRILSQNPHLHKFYSEAIPIFEKPLTISQISFQSKNAVENHIFMVGDSAGLIHPLCGNGMAMAIHSAKLFSELFLEAYHSKSVCRADLEKEYSKRWNETFIKRLQAGERIQRILQHPIAMKVGFGIAKIVPSILSPIIQSTHGKPIVV